MPDDTMHGDMHAIVRDFAGERPSRLWLLPLLAGVAVILAAIIL